MVRFQVSQTLDAIERRLTTDPLLAGAVVDLSEVVRRSDLDGGRPATLVRLGLAVDALAHRLGDDTAALYPVVERVLLSDTDLTSNERMVIRRWSDDGLVEVVPAGASVTARLREIAALTGLPVIGPAAAGGSSSPGYTLLPAPGGAALAAHPSAPGGAAHPSGAADARPAPHPALSRWWRCPEPECPSFGTRGGSGQPPPSIAGGAPTCPRHGQRLADGGPRPPAVPVTVRVDGSARRRFVVPAGRPVTVGRLPDDPGGVAIGAYLDEQGGRWVSRSHIRLELRDATLVVTDVSTNGSWVLTRPAPGQPVRQKTLPPGQPYPLAALDIVQLHEGVELRRADVAPAEPGSAAPSASVMADAPTIALRLPGLGSGG